MRLLPALLGLLPVVAAYYDYYPDTELELEPEPLHVVDLATASRPTIEQAAVQARRLVRREKIATLSTVFQKGAPDDLEGLPIGLMDYYADCSKDGSPALLAIKIATSFRNVANGSAISLSIRQHGLFGHDYFSPAAHHRLSLIGKLEKVDPDSEEAEHLKKCFLFRHHDAKWWTPGNKIHESAWMKFKVEKIYWIGGFGNVQQIGWIPLDLYQNVTLPCPHRPGHGRRPPQDGPPDEESPEHGGFPHWAPPRRGGLPSDGDRPPHGPPPHHGPPFGRPPFGGHFPFGHAPQPAIQVTCNCGPPPNGHYPVPPHYPPGTPGRRPHPPPNDHYWDSDEEGGHDGDQPGFEPPHQLPKPPKGPWGKPWHNEQQGMEL